MAPVKSARQLLLEQIASEGYNVGYSSSLHFATFDIASRVPTLVTVASFAIGILGLVYPEFADKLPSAILIIIGICMLYVRDYESRLTAYETTGIKLNDLYKQLHDLINEVQLLQDHQGAAIDDARARLIRIRSQASGLNVSPQIFGASWKAHHRFFWVIDSTWVRDNRNPRFTWRDKMPLSFFALLIFAILATLGGGLYFFLHRVCA